MDEDALMATGLKKQILSFEKELSLKNQAIESSISAIALTDIEGNIVYINTSFIKMFGFDNKNIFLRRNAASFWDKQVEATELMENIHEKGSWSGELTVRKKDGSHLITLASANIIRDNLDEGIAIMISFIDVSKQKELEDDFQTIFNSVNDGIIIYSLEGQFLEANQITFDNLGYPKDELMQMTVMEITPPELRETIGKQIVEIMYQGGGIVETISRCKDGSLVPVELNIRPIEYKGINVILAVARNISERKQMEEALRKSETSLANAQRIAHLGNWDWDIVNNEAYWSDEIYRIFGLVPHDFRATYEAFLNSVHPDDRMFVQDNVNKAIYENKPYSIEHRILLPDGSERIVHEQAEVTFNKAGKAIRMVGTVQDITERKQTEEKLLETAAKNEAILNVLPDFIFECKRDGTIVDYRATTEKDLYVPPNEFLGRKVIEILPKEVAWNVMHSIEQTIQTKELQSFQYQLPVNGKIFDFEARIVACGKDSALTIVSNISEHKKAEAVLKASKDKYSTLVEKGNDGIIVIQDYVVNFVNSKFGEITGYTKEQVIGIPVLDFVSEDYKGLVLDMYEKRIKNDLTIPYKYEIDLLSKDGKKIPVEISGSYIEYDGKPADMGIIRDITERKQIETALQKSEQKFRDIFNNSNDSIIIYDLDGSIIEVNEVACEFTGYSRDEMLSMSVMDLDSPEQAAKVPDQIKRLQKGKRAILESAAICKDGTPVPIELSNRLIEYEGKTAVLSIARDITERKKQNIK